MTAADDDEAARALVQRVLAQAGHEVSSCSDGQELLDRVKQEHPDVVVTDNDMPVKSGMQVVRELRADPQTADIPVLMASGSVTASDAAEVHSGGGEVVAKPFTAAQLADGVDAILSKTADADDPDDLLRGREPVQH